MSCRNGEILPRGPFAAGNKETMSRSKPQLIGTLMTNCAALSVVLLFKRTAYLVQVAATGPVSP